jgi:hypothetical protein
MTVKVELLNGKVIYPSFDPEHTESVLAYYQNELDEFGILSYEVIG